MYAPFYDALKVFFEHSAKHGGSRVPVVFAMPDRAHNEYTRVQQRRQQGKATPQAIEDRPAATPFMSVFMTPPKFDNKRFNPGQLRGITKNVETGTALSVRFPRPFTSNIQLDLWCSEGGDLVAQNVTSQIDLRFFAESVYLPIDWTLTRWYRPPFSFPEHTKYMGKTRFRLIADSWRNTSNLQYGDRAKEVRYTWTGSIEGYVPYRPVESRLILDVSVGVYDEAAPDTLLFEETLATTEN